MADLYSTYQEETLALARSILIKFDFQNTLINSRLAELGYNIGSDPKEWKYNLNLAGLYHERDVPITIISNDTQEEILFTKEVLVNHPRTSSDYRPGNEAYYDQLVAKYPIQRILINAITRPLTLNQVVAARDFQILDWDTSLVASNEVSLIRRLQTWVDDYVAVNWNPDFLITDPYYAGTWIAVMQIQMAIAIDNIRKELSHTSEVSSFHLWTYLAGFYGLDRYRNVLTHDQAMWLYFNIRETRGNLGRKDKMQDLLDVLIKGSGLRMNSIRIQHDDTELETDLFKKTKFIKESLTSDTEALYEPIPTLVNKTINLGLDNAYDEEYDIQRIEQLGKYSKHDDRIVGLLEAEQDGSVLAETVETYQLRWKYSIYLAHLGIYEDTLSIQLPNGRTRSLKIRDAVILYFFAKNNIQGETVVSVPSIRLDWLMPQGYPPYSTLRTVFTENVSDEDINTFSSKRIDLSVNTKSEFEKLISDINGLHQWQELQWESKTSAWSRAETEQLANALWISSECLLAPPGTTYNDWLRTVQINKYDFGESDWVEMSDAILTAITGEELESDGLPVKQKALLEIFDQLTSYSVRTIVGDTSAKSQSLEIPSIHYEVTMDVWTDEHEIPVGRMYNSEDAESYDIDQITVPQPSSHIYDEDETIEYLIETGKDIYFDEELEEVVEIEIIGPGGIIYQET